MDIGLMVEGQNGLTWERWEHIVRLADRLGFHSLFRSDHYFIGPQQDSLEAYLSFVVAARESSRIRFGPLVSPVTFRRPVDVGRMAAQIDELSGGRFVMGVGAGWNEAEHRAYGLEFPPTAERFERLEEWIQLLRPLWGEGPATYEGRYYRLEGADCLPRPGAGRPPILVGGNGERKTLRLAAKYANEWNGINLMPAAYREKMDRLREHCEREGRDLAEIRRSMMVFGIVGPSTRELDEATAKVKSMFAPGSNDSLETFREGLKARGMLVGGTDEVVDTLGQLAEAGLEEVAFQHFMFDSDAVPEYLANEIAPKVRAL